RRPLSSPLFPYTTLFRSALRALLRQRPADARARLEDDLPHEGSDGARASVPGAERRYGLMAAGAGRPSGDPLDHTRAMTEIGQWVDTWRELGVRDSPQLRRLHDDVLGRYSEPHRHYHTYQHLAECFEKVQDIIHLAEHPGEVDVGLWFHDVIYDTQRHDNEERSAAWARSATRELGASAESAQRIYDLI